jgi:hypothetical protein
MYPILLFSHSYFRWLVLVSMIYAIFKAYKGYKGKAPFTAWDDTVRHSTTTIVQIQFMLGMVLFSYSPIVRYFWKNFKAEWMNLDLAFFGLLHISIMFIAVSIISAGSSLAKRETDDHIKFRTMLIYFSLALLLIFLAIPWPFSPLTARPYLRF